MLQKVAASRRHVAQLPKPARIALAVSDNVVRSASDKGRVGTARRSPLPALLDAPGCSPISSTARAFDILFHQVIRLVPPAVIWLSDRRNLAHRVSDVGGAGVLIDRGCPSPADRRYDIGVGAAAANIAAHQFANSSALFALPSAIRPAAERIWPSVQ